MTDLRDILSETGSDVVQSAPNQTPSSDILGPDVLQTTVSSPCNSVSSGSVLGTAACDAHATTDVEASSDFEQPCATEAIPMNDSPKNETASTTEAPPLTPEVPSGVKLAFNQHRVDTSAHHHRLLETRGSDDDLSSESSVSVGSYFGQSPQAPSTTLSEARNTSPFTFTTMPGAGHGVLHTLWMHLIDWLDCYQSIQLTRDEHSGKTR